MATTGQQIADLVSRKLKDEGATRRWVQATSLIHGINEAQLFIAEKKPGSVAKTEVMVLVAGTKQSVGSGYFRLLDIIRNMGTDGNTPGAPVGNVSRSMLDAVNRAWHSEDGNSVVDDYAYDPTDNPTAFYVTPPQPSSSQGYIELVRAALPPALASLASNLTVADEYRDAVVEYVVGWALEQETEEQDYRKAAIHKGNCLAMIGFQSQTDDEVSRRR